MKFIYLPFILVVGYYTFTYGINLWNNKNKLGGVGVWLIALIGTFGPIIVLVFR